MPRLTVPVAVLALLFVVSAAWGWDQARTRQGMEGFLHNEYQRSFYQLVSQVRGLEVLLGKSLAVCGDSEDAALFAEIYHQAMNAQENLTRLPVESAVMTDTAKFLTQVGDYANSLLRRSAAGGSVSDEQWDTLRRLQDQAAALNAELHRVERQTAAGGVRHWRREAPAAKPLKPQDNEFESLNREMEVFPTLIYDGPFSDHLENPTPKSPAGKNIDEQRARAAALEAVDRSGGHYRARVTGSTRGLIPSLRVEVQGDDDRGDRFTVDVARKGGEVVWMLNAGPHGPSRISVAEAKEKAERYLAERDLAHMRVTYSERQGDAVVFNCAATQDGVILYPDLIKVTVALDDGRIIGREAAGYILNHHRRENLHPAVGREQAREKVSRRLKVTNSRPAVIPTGGGGEVLTWEFRAEAAGNTYLVYVNADNGRQERILQLIETPDGELTQ